jgi:L-cysteate sulfo-lyase
MSLIEGIPRATLGHWPTPLEELPRLADSLGGPHLLIKRDDQTGLATGGNKTRALEFLVGDALARDADTLITAGSRQPNHARQTAAAAAKCGLRCHLVLRGQRPSDMTGNLLLDHVLDACIHWAGEQPLEREMQRISEALRNARHRPYVVPYGGSNELGILGYAVGMEEFAAQTASQGIEGDRIVVGSAFGGQQAGLVLGSKALGLDVEILGIATEKRRADAIPFMLRLAAASAQRLGLGLSFEEQDFQLREQYLGSGYATPGEADWEAIHVLATTEGILVDPVYSGRAMAGLIDLIRGGVIGSDETVCFWHTGGAVGIFAWEKWLLSESLGR